MITLIPPLINRTSIGLSYQNHYWNHCTDHYNHCLFQWYRVEQRNKDPQDSSVQNACSKFHPQEPMRREKIVPKQDKDRPRNQIINPSHRGIWLWGFQHIFCSYFVTGAIRNTQYKRHSYKHLPKGQLLQGSPENPPEITPPEGDSIATHFRTANTRISCSCLRHFSGIPQPSIAPKVNPTGNTPLQLQAIHIPPCIGFFL